VKSEESIFIFRAIYMLWSGTAGLGQRVHSHGYDVNWEHWQAY